MKKSGQPIAKLAEWYEWPLLGYFLLHFFPPFPAALPNICLILSVIGILTKYRKRAGEALHRLNHPVAWLWLSLAGLLAISIFQAPAELRGESWHRLFSDLGKGTLFGAVLLLHLDHRDKARRLLVAAVVAAAGMLLHYLATAWEIVDATGVFPVQRDYLYWLLLYFPLALGCYFLVPCARWPAAVVVIGIVGLAVTTGFRGAMLSLAAMFLTFASFPKAVRVLLGGILLALVGVIWLALSHPEQGNYVLYKLQQTDTSARVASHWLPAWELSLERPLVGHGFGHKIFSHKVHAGLADHPSWRPTGELEEWAPSSPHNMTLEVLFAAGFPGLIVLGLLFAALALYLVPPLWRERFRLHTTIENGFLYAILVSLLGSYLVFSQFETPAWRSLPVLIGLALGGLQLIEHNKDCMRTRS